MILTIFFSVTLQLILKPELQKNKFNAVYKIQEGMKNNKNIIWVYFDIETTSNDTNDHNIRNGKIIEIGAFYNENNTFSELCNPSISITNSHIHGITDSMVTDKCTTENTLYNLYSQFPNLRRKKKSIKKYFHIFIVPPQF